MTTEERQKLGNALIDVTNELLKYDAENAQYSQLAKNIGAISTAITDADNREIEHELKRKELELEEQKRKSESKRGWADIAAKALLGVGSIAATIWAYTRSTAVYKETSEHDVPSKDLEAASRKARDSALDLMKKRF